MLRIFKDDEAITYGGVPKQYCYELTDRNGEPLLQGEGYGSSTEILDFISQIACVTADCFKNVVVEE
jgi:hypothetical protein